MNIIEYSHIIAIVYSIYYNVTSPQNWVLYQAQQASVSAKILVL